MPHGAPIQFEYTQLIRGKRRKQMPANLLRQRLKENQASYGLWVTLESPAVTEIAVLLGLHWVCIDMEHGHLGYREVIEHLRVTRGTATTPLVRVPTIERSAIQRSLDMGAQGLILPMVRGRADVETALRLGRYPPRGVRGIGGERAVQWGLSLAEYLRTADDETLLIPLIETREAVEEITAILDTPGLEAIFFGPADLSASYGYKGEWQGLGVAQRILEIRMRAAERGIAAGVLSQSIADARGRRDQGFQMVGLGSDAGLMIRSLQAALEAL